MSALFSAQQLLEIFFRYCRAISSDPPDLTELTPGVIKILREAVAEPCFPLYMELHPDLTEKCHGLSREGQQHVLDDFRAQVLQSCRAWEHRSKIEEILLSTPATDTDGLKIPKTIFKRGAPLKPLRDAVEKLMVRAYTEDPHMNDNELIDRATQIAASILEEDGNRDRVHRVWYNHCLPPDVKTKKLLETLTAT